MNMEYHRQKGKEHYQKYKSEYKERNKIRREAFTVYCNEYKSSRGCLICKEDCPASLDLHHVSEDKENEVSQMRHMSMKRIEAEIAKCVVLCAKCVVLCAKCVVLCANCHRKHHAGLIELPCSV